MKKTLIAITAISISLFLFTNISKSKDQTFNKDQLVDAQVSAFYTGCAGGLVAVIETGHFTPNGKAPMESFKAITDNCKRQQAKYGKWLRGK